MQARNQAINAYTGINTPDKSGSHVESENGRVQFVSSTTSMDMKNKGGGNIYNNIIGKGDKKGDGNKRMQPYSNTRVMHTEVK